MKESPAKTYGDTKVGRDGLTDKQRAFVLNLVGMANDGEFTGNMTGAYVAAGYAPGAAPSATATKAWILRQQPHIQAAIKWHVEEAAGKEGIGPEYVRRRLYRLSQSNAEGLLTSPEPGQKPEIDFDKLVECGGVEWIKKFQSSPIQDEDGNPVFDKEGKPLAKITIELHDPEPYLVALAKMFGMLNDKVIHSGTIQHTALDENELMRRILSDPESAQLAYRIGERVAIQPGRPSEPSN